MFQFRRFPSYTYVFSIRYMSFSHVDCSIRISAGLSLLTTHRSFSQLTTSFIGSQCQGIRPALLLALPFAFLSSLKLLYNCSFSRLSIFLYKKSCRFTWLYFFRYSIFKFLFCPFWEQKQINNFFFIYLFTLSKHSFWSWWAQVDSNHRPHAYQACALTTWAMRPSLFEKSSAKTFSFGLIWLC